MVNLQSYKQWQSISSRIKVSKETKLFSWTNFEWKFMHEMWWNWCHSTCAGVKIITVQPLKKCNGASSVYLQLFKPDNGPAAKLKQIGLEWHDDF